MASATARNIHLSGTEKGIVFPHHVREDSARAVSEVLQEDMDTHHVFFNQMGFHSKFLSPPSSSPSLFSYTLYCVAFCLS